MTQIAKNVLKSDESNYFSAMVLGITFAESAHLSTAWKIFSSLLESCEFEEIFMINSAKLAILMVSRISISSQAYSIRESTKLQLQCLQIIWKIMQQHMKIIAKLYLVWHI